MAVRKSASTGLKSAPAGSSPSCEESHFIYRSNALAVGGRFTRAEPLEQVDLIVPTLAASFLAGAGGRAERTVEEYRLCSGETELLYLGSATSKALSPLAPIGATFWTSTASIDIEDLRIRRLSGEKEFAIVVKSLSASLTTEHRASDPFPRILPGACRLPVLLLGGKAVQVDINVAPFRELPTKAELDDRVANDRKFAASIGWRPGSAPYKGAMCTVVRSLKLPKDLPPEITYDPAVPNRILWKGVGRIYLGELQVTEGLRRLTMLRVRLGCAVDGDLDCGIVETDGHLMP